MEKSTGYEQHSGHFLTPSFIRQLLCFDICSVLQDISFDYVFSAERSRRSRYLVCRGGNWVATRVLVAGKWDALPCGSLSCVPFPNGNNGCCLVCPSTCPFLHSTSSWGIFIRKLVAAWQPFLSYGCLMFVVAFKPFPLLAAATVPWQMTVIFSALTMRSKAEETCRRRTIGAGFTPSQIPRL